MMLAYTREDVGALNGLARERMKADGELGPDHAVKTTRGMRDFATQDRVMFLRNERSLGVKNGTLGTVETIGQGAMGVRLDDGRRVSVDLKTYNDVDHGYAATIHKSQGVTVDRTHVLASGHMDRHAAYVALSRHRDGVALHYSRQDFPERRDLVRTLGRERPKEMALDYPKAFAARRQIDGPADGAERSRFAGFNPKPAQSKAPDVTQDDRTAHRAVRGYASAVMDAQRMRQAGLPILEHQKLGLERGAQAVAGLWPGAAKHLASAVEKSPGLLAAAAQGRTGAAVAAMKVERLAPEKTRSLAKGMDHDRGRSPGDEPSKSRGRDRGWER
jgi:hypothetical protein